MLHRNPLFRVVFPVLFGVFYAEYVSYSSVVFWAISVICLFFLSYLLFTRHGMLNIGFKYPFLNGLMLTLCLFCGTTVYTDSVRIRQTPLPDGKELLAKMKILGLATEREKSYRIEARMVYYMSDSMIYSSDEKIVLYISKEVNCTLWERNDLITVKFKLNTFSEPLNPGEFNVRKFNNRKGFFYTAYLRAENILHKTEDSSFSFLKEIDKLEKYMVSLPDKYMNSPAEKSLAKALVLGYKDDLDDETISRFSKSGTSHILAVSGLHVGILWLLIENLLFALNKRKRLRWVKFFISLSLLWAYALLTGLSPSVMRASIMFSFFAYGALINAKYNSFNILCLACIVLVYLDPMVVFSAGFQLSFSAVAGILFLYPLCKNAIYFTKSWKRKLWELTSITLSAQIATMPISLYWFGQFPIYFAFANLPMVPLAGVALNTGILALMLEKIPYLGGLLFHLFMLQIKLLNSLAAFFSALPFSIATIHIGMVEAVLLYIIIILMSYYVVKPVSKLLVGILLSLLLFITLNTFHIYDSLGQNNLVVYSTKGGNVIRHHVGNYSMEWKSHSLSDKTYQFSVKPSDKAFRVQKVFDIHDENGFLTIGNHKILVLHPEHLSDAYSVPISIDWVLVDGLNYFSFDRLYHNFKFTKIIFGANTSFKSRTYWTKECEKRSWNFWDLSKSGAMIRYQ